MSIVGKVYWAVALTVICVAFGYNLGYVMGWEETKERQHPYRHATGDHAWDIVAGDEE